MNLKEKLEKKLKASKFRLLNERMYENTKLNPENTAIYHEYYALQANNWPTNPLDTIILHLDPLAFIVDIGCGEAAIASKFERCISLDINPTTSRVVQCDIKKPFPLVSAAFDAAVFCLSLMFENATFSLKEANRILKRTGKLYVAEVVSRIPDTELFIKQIQSIGFKLDLLEENEYFVVLIFSKAKQRKGWGKVSLKHCPYKKV